MKKTKTPRTTLAPGLAKVLKRLHYPLEVILLCVRWYVAYSLSLRNLAEMMDERGIAVDHSTVYRWVIKLMTALRKEVPQAQASGWEKLANGRECVTNTSESLWCCSEDGSRPPEAGLQEQASNRPVLLRSKGVVVSDRGKVIHKDGRYVLRR
ncbi:hypothetical protein QFZ98_004521 [Paraburkholderia youngii]